jgi:hypothetical protein
MCTGTRMVRAWSAGDGLADPPGRVGGELVAAGVVELLHRADQAEVTFLDQVEEHQPPADVALGDRHHQPQVRLDQPLLGLDPLAREQFQVAVDGAGHRDAAAELLLGEQARLDRLGQLHLVLGGQQRHAADFPQVDPHQVAGGGLPDLGVGTAEFGLILAGHVQHVHALIGQRAHRGVERLGGQVGAVQRHQDVGHGHRSAFPP